MSCGVGLRCSWDPALLWWLWCRPAALAWIWPQGISICRGYSPKEKKKSKKQNKTKQKTVILPSPELWFSFIFPLPQHRFPHANRADGDPHPLPSLVLGRCGDIRTGSGKGLRQEWAENKPKWVLPTLLCPGPTTSSLQENIESLEEPLRACLQNSHRLTSIGDYISSWKQPSSRT